MRKAKAMFMDNKEGYLAGIFYADFLQVHLG